MRRGHAVGGLLALALLSTGCEGFLTGFAAGSTVRVLRNASPAVQRFSDIELAEAAIPGSIATMEGLMLIKSDDEDLHEILARSYASYGFGFLEDHMEQAQADDNEERMEHYRARASAAYMRSRQIAFEQMTAWEGDDGGADRHHNSLENWNRYLSNFDSAEQAGIMFWGAYAWARYIGLHRDDVDALGDLPYVVAMVQKVIQLNPAYNGYAPRAMVAGLWASTPEQLGGKPREAVQEFEAAFESGGRKNLMYPTLQARLAAVALQDRAMFRRLLEGVIQAGDIDPDNRLQNQIAKRRAQRYLAQIDDLFAPEGENPAGDGTGAGGPQGEPSQGGGTGGAGGAAANPCHGM